MNRGVPPTALNARTGEFTPPGVTRWARANHSADAAVVRPRAAEARVSLGTPAFSPTAPDRGQPPVTAAAPRR